MPLVDGVCAERGVFGIPSPMNVVCEDALVDGVTAGGVSLAIQPDVSGEFTLME